MYLVCRLLVLVALALLTGCGDKSGSAEIKQATAEQERQLQEQQQQVNSQERQHAVSGGKALGTQERVNREERQRGR